MMLERKLGERGELVREAKACARAIERERTEWAAPLATILRAGMALHAGDRTQALRGLDLAAGDFAARGLDGYSLAARDRAARLRGPSAAGELARVAEAFGAEDVVSPERMSRMLVPGFSP
jgi:hypothetical protein